jgi:hypothetical protein
VLKHSACLSHVVLVSMDQVLGGYCFDAREDVVDQCHDPFDFVMGRAGGACLAYCAGVSP